MANLVVKIKPRGSQAKQLLLIVGGAVAKKAVVRNRLKRRLRAIMRPILKDKDNDFLIIARPGAAEATFSALKEEIKKILK